jgi:two-component system, chemotaxis family, chemotaxis protein CheY
MKVLIVEDDFTSRLLLQKLLAPYGESHIAVNGREAVTAFEQALAERAAYDLICLDIMMPELDGIATLREVRAIETRMGLLEGEGVKVIMCTALKDMKHVSAAYNEFCDSYMVKPVDKAKLIEQLVQLRLIAQPA